MWFQKVDVSKGKRNVYLEFSFYGMVLNLDVSYREEMND